MTQLSDYRVEEDDGVLTIHGQQFSKPDEQQLSHWVVQPIDDDRFLVRSRQSTGDKQSDFDGFGQCSSELFANFLLGLVYRKWSGHVSVDTLRGTKKLVFRNGEFCFASSNVIDDRLGEVIYRSGQISLDQLTESAVKVTRATKFGQVLINSGLFTAVDLWEALKLQFREILRSVFLVPSVYFEVFSGQDSAPTEVDFQEGSRSLIENSFGFGCMFQQFLERISATATVEISTPDASVRGLKPGTFRGDLLGLIRSNPSLQTVVETSKLMDINTYVAIMGLVNSGYCRISPFATNELARDSKRNSLLKTRIDAYSYMIRLAQKVLAKQGQSLPTKDLKDFTNRLNPPGIVALFLSESGELDPESVRSMFVQCLGDSHRVEFYASRIGALIQFLVQMTSDLLPFEEAQTLKEEFRKIRHER